VIRLAHPSLPDRAKFMQAVQSILDDGAFTRGKHVEAFEEALAERLGCEHCIAVSSGTAALHLSLISLEVGAGDSVVAPAFTFPATTNVVEVVNATTRFVDVELESFSAGTDDLVTGVDQHTKAVIAVHPFGTPSDIGGLRTALPPSVSIIEDAAAALGAELDGEPCGTLGDLACFSFHPRKIITTGEGGAIVTSDSGLADEVRALRNHGLVAGHGASGWLPRPGLNYRLAELPAALGLAQIGHLDALVERRIELRGALVDALERIGGIHVQTEVPGARSAWSTFACRVEGKSGAVVCASLRQMGVEATIGAYAVPELPHYATKYGLSDQGQPIASRLGREVIALPFHEEIGSLEIRQISRALSTVLGE
jgi:perosamine synthetase